MGVEPGAERGGPECEIDETRAGDGEIVGFAHGRCQSGNELFRDSAGIELPRLCVTQHTIGLKIAVSRFGNAHFRHENIGVRKAGSASSRAQIGIKSNSEIERKLHRTTTRATEPAGKGVFLNLFRRCNNWLDI